MLDGIKRLGEIQKYTSGYFIVIREHSWSSGKVQDSWSLDYQYCEFEPHYGQRVCVPGQDT